MATYPEEYPVRRYVLEEEGQGHNTRKDLYENLEKEFKRPVISYFTSFTDPHVMIEDEDADMLEGILQKLDLSKGLALIISSPGGIGITAERIINICRNYSETNEYWAIVPGKAKSAATMICFGASKILMSATSELGPIDPQIGVDAGMINRLSVFNVIRSYKDLFERAENLDKDKNLAPYLQQLEHYAEKEIIELQQAVDLSKDIAVRYLHSGMMKKFSKNVIEKKIEIFLTPEHTKEHGRAIYRDEALACGLKIDFRDVKDRTWQSIYELYVRASNFVMTRASKLIESKYHMFVAGGS